MFILRETTKFINNVMRKLKYEIQNIFINLKENLTHNTLKFKSKTNLIKIIKSIFKITIIKVDVLLVTENSLFK